MNGQARALIESMPNELGTEAVSPLSFDEAFTLHHRAVFRTARAVVRDSALAEDVTQEVFLRLYRNLDSTPGEDLLRAWLLRVTLNVARNTIRGSTRSMVRDNEYQKSSVEYGGFVEAPEEDYERRLAIEEARRALDRVGTYESCRSKTAGTLLQGDSHQFVVKRANAVLVARTERVCEGLRENRQMMRQCLDEAMLQSYFDGELSTKLMESATLHLASCATCAAAARELEEENALLSEAFALEFSESVPTERLRHKVDAAIAGIQIARPVVQQPSGVSGFFSSLSSLFSFSPQRAFGYAALMVVLAFGLIFGLVKFRSSAPVKSANEPQVAVNIQPNPGPTATTVF